MRVDTFGIERVGTFTSACSIKAAEAGLNAMSEALKPRDIDGDGPLDDPGPLAFSLIQEELEELMDAYYNKSKAEVLKEMMDVQYVLARAMYLFGMGNVVDAAFNRVHDNNMLKINTGSFREDGKLVKPADHPKTDLSDLEY